MVFPLHLYERDYHGKYLDCYCNHKSHKCFSGRKVEVHYIILGIRDHASWGGGGGVMPKAYDCVKWEVKCNMHAYLKNPVTKQLFTPYIITLKKILYN